MISDITLRPLASSSEPSGPCVYLGVREGGREGGWVGGWGEGGGRVGWVVQMGKSE